MSDSDAYASVNEYTDEGFYLPNGERTASIVEETHREDIFHVAEQFF